MIQTLKEIMEKREKIFCSFFKRHLTKEECNKFFLEDHTVKNLGCVICEHNPEKDIVRGILPLEDIKEKGEGGEMAKIELTHKVAMAYENLKKSAQDGKFSMKEVKILAKNESVSIVTIMTYVARLVKEGLFKKIGRGNYQILDVEYTKKEKSKRTGRLKKEEARLSGIKTKEELETEIGELQKRIDILKTIRDNYDIILR